MGVSHAEGWGRVAGVCTACVCHVYCACMYRPTRLECGPVAVLVGDGSGAGCHLLVGVLVGGGVGGHRVQTLLIGEHRWPMYCRCPGEGGGGGGMPSKNKHARGPTSPPASTPPPPSLLRPQPLTCLVSCGTPGRSEAAASAFPRHILWPHPKPSYLRPSRLLRPPSCPPTRRSQFASR